MLTIPSSRQCSKGAEFVYRVVKFTTQQGVLKWVASNGNHILQVRVRSHLVTHMVTATLFGDRRCSADLRKLEAERKHWQFQCPY